MHAKRKNIGYRTAFVDASAAATAAPTHIAPNAAAAGHHNQLLNALIGASAAAAARTL